MSSWRTTVLGVLAVLGAVFAAAKALLDGDPITNPDWAVLWAAIMAGIGLIKARDQQQHEDDVE